MTPASDISWYRSLPSRVRSPTPANTDTPPWSFAMLLISSMMTTVFPTPAPPNAPTFPPFRKGQIKSITLIPVGRSWGELDCSTNGPRTLTIVPMFIFVPVCSDLLPKTALSIGLSASNLQQFLRDIALSQLVVFKLQILDQIFGAVGCILH